MLSKRPRFRRICLGFCWQDGGLKANAATMDLSRALTLLRVLASLRTVAVRCSRCERVGALGVIPAP
jgi:hypothetical protein